MTEAEWLACKDPTAMLAFLHSARGEARRKAGRRRFRLLACACVRGIWPLLGEHGGRHALYYAERYADGEATERELQTAGDAVRRDRLGTVHRIGLSADWHAAEAAGHLATKRFDGGDHPSQFHASHSAANAWAIHQSRTQGVTHGLELQARLALHAQWLRDIFGNPFRPVSFDPSWLTSTVTALASQMYESRDFSPMPILADTLQDVGCTNEDILNHCRGEGPHVRGCWVVDLVLGKE